MSEHVRQRGRRTAYGVWVQVVTVRRLLSKTATAACGSIETCWTAGVTNSCSKIRSACRNPSSPLAAAQGKQVADVARPTLQDDVGVAGTPLPRSPRGP